MSAELKLSLTTTVVTLGLIVVTGLIAVLN
ncbi:YnhF family membrane protein [Trabulsiella guamensis]|nr:YnhF family membrane protein [Trabulsiella guamensis]